MAMVKKKKIIWRDKSENYKNAKLLIKEENGRKIEISSWKRHYLKQYFTAPRCLICYDKLNLNADIVLGDPWGVQYVDWIRGESLVLCRTSIGQTIINQMIQSNLVSLRQVEPYYALKGQAMEMRLSNIRKNMLLYREKGWILPKYSDLILSDAIEKPTYSNRKIIDEFNKDSQKTKKTIVRKYRRRISIMSFKNNIYKIFSLSNSEAMINFAKRVARESKTSLLILAPNFNQKDNDSIIINNAGPREFLGYIKNADLVITDSFHGTVFP